MEMSLSLAPALAHAVFTLGVVYIDGSASPRTYLLVSISSFILLVLYALAATGREKKSMGNTQMVARTESFSRKFSVSIIDIRYHNGKVEYLLKGQYNSFVWTSWKRYSALRKLRPFLPEVEFPPKTSLASYFAANEFDLRFVEQRRTELNIMFTKYVNKDVFENGIPDSIREEALGVPVNSIEIEKATLSREEVLREAMTALEMASQCASSINPTNIGGGAATEGWQMYGKNKTEQVCGYTKETNDFTFFSARGIVDRFTKDQVFAFVTNPSKRAKWDEGFKFEQLLQSFDVSTLNNGGVYELLKLDVYRTGTSSPAKQFVAERDSVCLTVQAKRKSDGALFHCFRSVNHSQAPAGMEGYVRAIVFCAGFIVETRMDGKPGCVLTSVGMVDPVGKIPKWVIALALKNNTWQPWTMVSQQTSLE